jgi:hypothetical protein
MTTSACRVADSGTCRVLEGIVTQTECVSMWWRLRLQSVTNSREAGRPVPALIFCAGAA